jgi:hypothetical protein
MKMGHDIRLYKEGQGINFTKIPEIYPSKIEYKFSTGQAFDLYSKPDGECKCIVTNNGEQVFDLAQYIPQNSRFVNEKYLDRLYEKQYGTASIEGTLQSRRDNRRAHARKIKGKTGENITEYLIDAQPDTNSPKDIFILLHEIGHAVDFFEDHQSTQNATPIYELSRKETAAWLNALKIAVDIYQKYGINMLEFFDSYQDLENFIKQALASYRKSEEHSGATREEIDGLFDLGELDTLKTLGIQLFEKR